MAEDAEVGESDDGDDEMVEISPLFKKPNAPMEYLTFLRSNADRAPFEKRWAHLIILTIVEAPS